MKKHTLDVFVKRGRYLLSSCWLRCGLFVVAGAFAMQKADAASQTWTNAPVSGSWTNVLNWVGQAVPGDINQTSANTVNADIATFNSPLSGGIGGVANPVVPDDGTVVNGRSRRVLGVTFDTTNCGAYVIYSPSTPAQPSSSSPATGILYVSHNGSIQMTPPVTNTETVLIPLYVNLPSSTPGVFNLVNNSTNPAAALVVSSVTHAGATTRGTTFVLDGTNTAFNVVSNLSEGVSAGGSGNAGGITKQGPGTWNIAAAGTFLAVSAINIVQGTLGVQDAGAFGSASTAVVTNATLRIDGVTLSTALLTLRNGGVIRMNGSGTVNGVTNTPVAGANTTLATTSPADVMTLGNAANTVSGGAADAVLHVTGPGTVLLPYSANYAGKWSVDAGTNQISTQGALGTGANLNVNAGAVFDITPMGATSYTLDTKAFSANGTGTAVGSTAATVMADASGIINFGSKPVTLTFTPASFSGDVGHPAFYCSRGTLAFNGNAITVNNAAGTPLGAGTYQLVSQASGSITSSGAFVAIVTGSGLASGMIGEITASGGNLNLIVSAYTPKSLVWTGADPLLPGVWDRQNSTNWLSGATPVTFNIYDAVTFNAAGSSETNVNIAATMVPGIVTVDTGANNYTFSGAGQIAGGTSLVKVNSGTLILATANTYTGGTIVSNGVVQLAIDEGVSSAGVNTNDLTINSPGVFDLNNFSNTVNGLNGNGTVDITGGGTSTLLIGYNGDSGVFSGRIQNSNGSLGIFKTGSGMETLTASNSYIGPTTIDNGTLRVTNSCALGAGNSAVTINSGTLDLNTSLVVSNLNGGGAVINSSTTTNVLTIASTSVYSGVIAGKIQVLVTNGTLRLNGANTYSNGTILAAGTGLAFGPSGANAGTAGVTASNNATLSLANAGSSSSNPGNTITTVDGATVTFVSSNTANAWAGQFVGSALATNIFYGGAMTISATNSFTNFLGTVIITNGEVRWFNASCGGDNTLFDFVNGGCFARDSVDVIHLGALFGNGTITAPSVSAPATYMIGGKGIDCEYSGSIVGSNNLVKIGPGRLTLDGLSITTNTDNTAYTNYLYGGTNAYLGYTTISNGVLALSVPDDLTASPTITLAATNAILDVMCMGYVTNFNDGGGNADSALVTNSWMTVVAATTGGGANQTLGGIGMVKGAGVINNGTLSPGFATAGGTLVISNDLVINAGATNSFGLSDDPTGAVKSSDLLKVVRHITLSGTSVIGIYGLNGVLNVGTYPLIKYGGSLSNETGALPPGLIPNFTVGGLFPSTTRASMYVTNKGGEIDLTVVTLNSTNLTWLGDGASNWWDVVSSYNWTNSGGVVQYYQLDNVLFNNLSTNPAVTLDGTLAPAAITVSGATNYSFGGSGSIGGDASLTMSGTGFLLLTNGANSYAGGTVINSGVLKLGAESGGNQNDLGLGTGPVTVNTNAMLLFGGNGGSVVVHLVTNAIVVNGGIVKAQDGAQHLTNSTVTINAAGGTFQTMYSTKNLVLDSPLAGTGGFTVAPGTNTATGQVILLNGTNLITGPVSITTNGYLTLAGLAGLSNSPAVDIQAGGILDVSTRSNAAWSVTSGQTLKGNGVIRGKLITAALGSTVAPGIASAIGTLTITNQGNATNFAAVTLAGTLSMDLNRALTPNCDRIVNANGTNNLGGTLTVNNLGGTLVSGDSFQLFVGGTNIGSFATLNLPALSSGLAWSNSLAINGKLTVVATVIVPTVAPGITNFGMVGGNVVVSGTNAQAGATYYLLATTNVAYPRAQWRTVATNVLGAGNFAFTGTNSVVSGSGQQFYMLSSTNYNP